MMSGEYYVAEEEIAIPQHLMDTAFRNGLKSHKLLYLDELKSLALSDSFFEGQKDILDRAFSDMKIYIGNQGSQIQNTISMKHFKLPSKMIDRLGYLAHQRSVISPVNDSSRSSRSTRSFQRSPSVQSEDNYDDDFEEEEVEEEYDDHMDHDPPKGSRYNSTITKLTNNFVGGNTPSPTKSSNSNTSFQQIKVNDGYFPKGRLQVIADDKSGSIRDNTYNRETLSSKKIQPQPTQSVDFDHRPSTIGKHLSTQAEATFPSQSKKNRQPQWIDAKEWRLGEKIGSGSFGEVYQAMNHKGKLFAVKKMNIIDKSSEVKNLIQEIRLMSALSHKNIVQYLGSWVDEDEGCLYIFQEWVPGGSVAHLLKQFGPFSATTVRFYTRQILCGLQYLHDNHIVHRDIKGGNILVDDSGTVKLADFGASTTLNDFNKTQETTTIKGTPYFMAPEVLSSAKYGRKGDIWAVGCTMIQMFTGEPPWKDRNLKSLIQLHILLSGWNEGPPPYNCKLPEDAKECLELCFKKNPDDRPNAAQLLQCRYLRDNDELDESYNMDQSFYRKNDSAGLSDSGLINKIETAIDSAVSKSRTSISVSSRVGQNEETFELIERRLKDKGAAKLNEPGQSGIDSGGTPTRRISDNPFGKNVPSKPAAIAPLPLDYNVSNNSANPTPRLHNDFGAGVASSTDVNTSVHLIKKKINEATTVKGSCSPSRSNSRNTSRTNSPRTYSHRYNVNSQSSNRDSEELTPQAYDEEETFYHSRQSRPVSHHRSDSYDIQVDNVSSRRERINSLERYNSRYYEEKQRDDDNLLPTNRRKEDETHLHVDSESKYGELRHGYSDSGTSNVDSSSSRRSGKSTMVDTSSGKDPTIRKSASAADSIGQSSHKHTPVPRLSHVEHSIDSPTPSNIAKSISARMPRAAERVDATHRPFTSKAALGQMKRSTVHSSAESSGSNVNLVKRATQQAALQNFGDHDHGQNEDVDEFEKWKCLKCNSINSNPDHCDFCATVRGNNGKRDPKAPLPKRL